MIKSVLTCCRVVACLLLPTFFNSAFALDTFDHNLSFTHTLELKPIPSYQIAKSTFLPDRYDDLGLSNYDSLDSNYNDKSCSSYPLSACPTGGKCEKCPFNITMYRVYACDDPYLKQDGTCVCPPKVDTSCTNDVCTKYCEDSCINKTCTPSPNQTNCTNGTQKCDNGCCQNTRDCCVPCTDKITSKPENSSYTYSSCTDGEGSKQIQTGWSCNSGYHEKNGACEKDCIVNSCSGYTLESCPANANCSSCTQQTTTCSGGDTMYKKTGCKSGYKDCNGTCVSSATCCGGCPSGKKCENGTCVSEYVSRACQYVGDIMYNDLTCISINDARNPNKKIVGIVFDVSSKINVMSVAEDSCTLDLAYDFCVAMRSSANGIDQWTLPTEAQLLKIYQTKSSLNNLLSQLGETQLRSHKGAHAMDDSTYWTNVFDYQNDSLQVVINFIDGRGYWEDVGYWNPTRCVFTM